MKHVGMWDADQFFNRAQ